MNIDELVVVLDLDPTKFNDKQKQALENFRKTQEEFEKRLKSLEHTNKGVENSFGDVSAAAQGLLGALAGAGMAAFARDTMNSVAATGRMAANIAVATDELSAFGRMIERNGGNAETAVNSMVSLTNQVERFKLLGEASPDMQLFAGTIGADLDSSAIDIYMKFVEWAGKHRDDIKQINVIGKLGGLDQGSINQAIKGATQVLKEYQAAQKGAVSEGQVDAMIRMQSAWVTLDQAIEKTGRDIVVGAEPAFTSIANAVSGWIERNQKLADSLGGILAAIAGLAALKPAAWVLRLLGLGGAAAAAEKLPAIAGKAVKGGGIMGGALEVLEIMKLDSEHGNSLRSGLRDILGIDDPHEDAPWVRHHRHRPGWLHDAAAAPEPAPASGGRDSAAVREKRIRTIAAMLNIDPDIAMRVSESEGFKKFSGDNNTSFGDFQLHVTAGGRGHALGDEFKKQTGLDPSDPRNEAAADLFFLKWVRKNGWDPNGQGDHGATRSGIGNWQGIGDINVTINTDTKSPRDHGRIAAEEIRKNLSGQITTQANTGLNN